MARPLAFCGILHSCIAHNNATRGSGRPCQTAHAVVQWRSFVTKKQSFVGAQGLLQGNSRAVNVAISLLNVRALDPDPAAAHSRASERPSHLGEWSVATEEDGRPRELVQWRFRLAPSRQKGPAQPVASGPFCICGSRQPIPSIDVYRGTGCTSLFAHIWLAALLLLASMCDSFVFELQRSWRAASPAGKRPAAFGSSAPRMGLPHHANSKLMGLHDDRKPRVNRIAPPPTAAYKPTETMRMGSADGSGWTHAERTRSWTDGLRAKDRGGPIEYVTQERTARGMRTAPSCAGARERAQSSCPVTTSLQPPATATTAPATETPQCFRTTDATPV